MKYLKSFNESLSNLTHEDNLDFYEEDKTVNKGKVKSFAESYLSYLMDDGFVIGVNLDREEGDPVVDLHLYNPDTTIHENDIPFLWKDIKNHFIPFMKMFFDNTIIPGTTESNYLPSKEYSFSVLKLYASPGSEVRSFRAGTDNLLRLLSDRFEVEEELREIEISNIRRI